MKIGVVQEIKDRENRVALSPQGLEELVKRGHSVMVERGAGIGSCFDELRDQILFTYLHLSGVEEALTEALLDRLATAIAYETGEDADGRLPLLAPMSGVAGSMALTGGNHYLARPQGGSRASW